ncbi:unnamed protein product [Coccothraustes coccothraustes]
MAFQGFLHLCQLYLDRNQLLEMSVATFQPVQVTLGQCANALCYLSRHLWQLPPSRYLHNICDLKLQVQQPYGDAPRVSTLQYLMLAGSHGGMGHLPAGIFKNLSQLCSLNLDSAGLCSPGPEVFRNLTQLKELCLAKNELHTLDVTLPMDLLL